MDKDLERLIKYIRKEDVVLFIGSGFSFKAGAPHVCDIIKGILKEGGEKFASENKDKNLRAVSESFVKACNGRNDLITLLNKLFNFEIKDTSDQDILRKIPHFKTIFTTNYDTLLENAYPQAERFVITSNEGCSYVDEKKVNIYKVHGDITTLNAPDGIIITESDYKNYFKTGRYELIWETLKIAFSNKHMLFVGYSLEDDNIIDIIKTVRNCIGQSMKGMFLVSPSLVRSKREQLRANHVTYIDAYADEVLSSVLASIKENIADDVRHNIVSKETFDKFVELNADLFTTIHRTENGNVIKDVVVKEGQERKDTIHFTVPIELKNNIEQHIFNDKITVWGSSIQVPAYRIGAEKMTKFSYCVNGIKFNGKDDISCLYVTPKLDRYETKFRLPSIKFVEPVTVVKYAYNNILHIDIETPICYLKFEIHVDNNKLNDVSSRVENKDSYTNNTDALKWIDALITMSQKGQCIKIDGLEFKSNNTNKRAIAEYKKIKEYYSIIRDIETETDITFTKYNQYSQKNHLNAFYLYNYLTGKGFKHDVPKNSPISFVIDTRNENNMPIEKFRTDTFVMVQCDPLGTIELNGKQLNIPYRTTVFMDCHADSITPLNEYEYKIVMHDAKNCCQIWCSDTQPKQEGNMLNFGSKNNIILP